MIKTGQSSIVTVKEKAILRSRLKKVMVLEISHSSWTDESPAGNWISMESAYASSSPSKIPIMQSTNHRFRADRSEIRWLDLSRFRTILLETKMGATLVVVAKVLLEHSPEMLLVENDRMIQAFPPD